MADIFFSYAPADSGRAQAIAEALRGRGIDVDWDRALLPGERYDSVITKRLAEAKAVVVLWSANSVTSNLIMDEAAMARDQGKLIPVRIDAIDTPIGFRQLQTADLAGFPGPGAESGLSRLAEALAMFLRGGVPKASPQPAFRPLPTPPPPHLDDPVDVMPTGRFLRTPAFFLWTGALAAFMGLLFFLSPVGVSDMGETADKRAGFLVGVIIVMFFIVGVGRAVIYWSRLIIGKPTRRYFGVEMTTIAVVAAGFALLMMLNPGPDTSILTSTGTGITGLAHALNVLFMTFMLLVPPVLFVLRAIRRIVGGRPKTA